MKLTTVKEVIKAIKEWEGCYTIGWRIQGKEYGINPLHKSKPIACKDEELEDELTENGYSCFCNPEHLAMYYSNYDYCNTSDQVIVFKGSYEGEGMDGEDILIPYDQEEIMYTIECDLFMKSCCELYEWEEDEISSWSN